MIMHGTMIERKCGARKGVNRGCGKKSDEGGRLQEKKRKSEKETSTGCQSHLEGDIAKKWGHKGTERDEITHPVPV